MKLAFLGCLALGMAYAQDCNAPPKQASSTVALPGHPFAVIASNDGCQLFVSLTDGKKQGIAVLHRSSSGVELLRVAELKARPAGLALTHDGKLLLAASFDGRTLVLDTRRLADGSADPVAGSFNHGSSANSVYVNITADDKLAFVSQERAQSITVIDLARARKNGFKSDAIIGQIPVGLAPIALTFSPDGKWLYTTSQVALDEWDWPKTCKPEGPAGAKSTTLRPEGAVIVVDVARAAIEPQSAVVQRVPAGCGAVRMAISPSGDRVYVSARGENSLLAFDAVKLRSGSKDARLGKVPVGTAPVPVAVIDQGRKVLVGGSNRFGAASAAQSLAVVSAAKIAEGPAAVLGQVPCGAFPREMSVSQDGRALFLTNYGSDSLQIIDVGRIP